MDREARRCGKPSRVVPSIGGEAILEDGSRRRCLDDRDRPARSDRPGPADRPGVGTVGTSLVEQWAAGAGCEARRPRTRGPTPRIGTAELDAETSDPDSEWAPPGIGIEHHVEEEEDEMFSQAQVFDGDEL